jgi:hypothetical protein
MVITETIRKDGINTNFQLNPKISFRIISTKVGAAVAIIPTANKLNVKNIELSMILIVFIIYLFYKDTDYFLIYKIKIIKNYFL